MNPAVCDPVACFSPADSNHLQNYCTTVPPGPYSSVTCIILEPSHVPINHIFLHWIFLPCPKSNPFLHPHSYMATSIPIPSVERYFIPSVKPSLMHCNRSVTCLCQTAIYLASLEEAENLFSPSGCTLCLTRWHCIYCKVRNSSKNLEKTATCRELNIWLFWD